MEEVKEVAEIVKGKKIKNELISMRDNDREKYEEFWKSFGRVLKFGVYSDYGAHKDACQDLLLFYSHKQGKLISLKEYVDAIRKKMIVFGMGPAGTGKTYLAMAMAITAFKNEEVGRIILTRPAIEAGEKLGFLPGDLQSKVDPYLRPLYDALHQIMGAESFQKNMEKGLIEASTPSKRDLSAKPSRSIPSFLANSSILESMV